MVVQVQNFALTYGGRTHTDMLNYQLSIPPNLTGPILEYHLDLTKFATVLENMLPSTFNVPSQQLLISGQVSVSVVWSDAIQETADTEFFRVVLGCDCSGAEALVNVGILEENARLIAEQIGSQNIQMVAPNSFSAEYTIESGQLSQIYAEWAHVSPPPPYETQPYDWIISAFVGLAIGGLYRRISGFLRKVVTRLAVWAQRRNDM